MRVTENGCVDCGLPCIAACRYKRTETAYCDICGVEADLVVDGEDMCEDCFAQMLDGEFHDLSLSERAKLLGVSYDCV